MLWVWLVSDFHGVTLQVWPAASDLDSCCNVIRLLLTNQYCTVKCQVAALKIYEFNEHGTSIVMLRVWQVSDFDGVMLQVWSVCDLEHGNTFDHQSIKLKYNVWRRNFENIWIWWGHATGMHRCDQLATVYLETSWNATRLVTINQSIKCKGAKCCTSMWIWWGHTTGIMHICLSH